MNLEQSEPFIKDLARYRQAINRMSTTESKNKLEHLISMLIAEVRYVDSQHTDLNVNKTLPSTIIDSRTKIFEIRNKIEQLIK